MTDARKPGSATWSNSDVDASSSGTARLQFGAPSVGQDQHAFVVQLDEAEVAQDLLRPRDAGLSEDRLGCFDYAQLVFKRANAEGVTPLAAQLAERHAQMSSDTPLHRYPSNPILDVQVNPLALQRVSKREQMD